MKFTAELRQNRSRGINLCDNNIIVDTPYCNGVSFNKIMPKGSLQKNLDFFHTGGGSTPNPHFLVKNKHGLKMCFKSF